MEKRPRIKRNARLVAGIRRKNGRMVVQVPVCEPKTRTVLKMNPDGSISSIKRDYDKK